MPHDVLANLDLSFLNAAGMPEVNLEQYLGLWAIEESAFQQMWQMIGSMNLAAHVQSASVKKTPDPSMADGIAVLKIQGTMTKRGSSFSDAGSTVKIRQQIRQVKADSSIGGVMLVIDSPGGTVAGTAELGADIADLAASKPMVTFAEDVMCSAALWAGVQAGKVFANSDHATVGSKGVFIGLYDVSGAAAKEGIRPVVIRTGDLKGTGFPGTEITDAQKLMLQQMVDASNVSFDAAMQKRKMSASALAELSRGGVFTGKAAVGMGLIDGIRSFDEALSELRSMIGSTGKRTMKMTETTSTAAGLKELEAACTGATADFVLNQMRMGATVATAQSAWLASLSADLKAAKDASAGLGEKLKISEAALADATGKLDASTKENVQLKADLEKAKKGSFKPLNDVSSKKAGDADDASGDLTATEAWNAKIEAEVKAGVERRKAAAKVVAKYPELHEAYLAEVNAAAKK